MSVKVSGPLQEGREATQVREQDGNLPALGFHVISPPNRIEAR
jgi:hypothetical protein